MVIRDGVHVSGAYMPRGPAHQTIEVEVDDAKLRSQLGNNFNGLEQPVAFVPYQSAAGVEQWMPLPMRYSGSRLEGGRAIDVYDVDPPLELNNASNVAQDKGFMVGLQTNQGEVWAQEFGQRYVMGPANEPPKTDPVNWP